MGTTNISLLIFREIYSRVKKTNVKENGMEGLHSSPLTLTQPAGGKGQE